MRLLMHVVRIIRVTMMRKRTRFAVWQKIALFRPSRVIRFPRFSITIAITIAIAIPMVTAGIASAAFPVQLRFARTGISRAPCGCLDVG